MTQLPPVSIITPSYNAARFIRETIDSVYAQEYPTIEHIIVDGGSRDNTLDILQEYRHLDWSSEPDRGQSHALNKGFARASGAIIGWLNSDDTYNAGTLKAVTRYFEESPETDVVYSDCQIIDEESRPIRLAKSRAFDFKALLLENYIHQPTVFFRRRVLEHTGPIDESLHLVMDWEYWARAGLRFSFRYIPEHVFANFRLCTGTKTSEYGPEFYLEWLRVLEEWASHAPEVPQWRKIHRLAQNSARARYFMSNVYQARDQHQWARVRSNLAKAIIQDPSWIRNYGTWSIAGDAILGLEATSLLRRVAATARRPAEPPSSITSL